MKFAKGIRKLGLLTPALFILFSSQSALLAQDDFLNVEPSSPQDRPPGANKLFEDEPPLEEVEEIPRSDSQGAGQNNFGSGGEEGVRQNLDFPEPKKGPSRPSTARAKGLPSLPGGTGGVPKRNERVRMDFVQADIEDVVKYFAERLQTKFIYDPSILSGKITIISPQEVSLEEAYGAFLSAMEVRGYMIYPAGKYFKVEKAANARKVPTPVYQSSTPNDDSFVTRIVTLKYLTVNDIRQAVRNLLSRTGGDVIEHAPTNTLIISDYAYNIRRIVQILNILDVEGFQERIDVIQLKNASATDVARQVTEFFPTSGANSQSPGRNIGFGGGGSPSPSPSGGVGDAKQAVVTKVVPDERTNSIYVMGSERGIEQVREFVSRVDRPVAGGGGLIHVYPLQNVKAEDISQTLSALASGAATSTKKGPAGGFTPPGMPPSQPNSGGGNSASILSGDIKVTADAATNSLVIQASQRDFEVLKGIIKKLDIRRRQVFIESAILEARVGRASNFGVKASGPFATTDALKSGTTKSAFIGSIGGVDLNSILQDATKLTGLALGFRAGKTYNIKTYDDKGNEQNKQLPLLSGILNLAASSSNVNVLSTPHIIATANEEANLSIGEEIPQAGGREVTSQGTNFSVVRVPFLTDITIKPQINADDYLTLTIKEQIDEKGDTVDVGTDKQYGSVKRKAQTTVIVKDQQTIVMGGLMKERTDVTTSKVPFLGDIPILGWLFKTRSVDKLKTNLLLFITPYIIKDTADMNNNFFRKLKEREGFLKELGVAENKGVPSAGLTQEQLKMLDPEYVKSLKLEPLTVVPEPTNAEIPSSPQPAAPIEVSPIPPAQPEKETPSSFQLPNELMKDQPSPEQRQQQLDEQAPAPMIMPTPAPSIQPIPSAPPQVEQKPLTPTSAPQILENLPPPPELSAPAPLPSPSVPVPVPTPSSPSQPFELQDTPPEDLGTPSKPKGT